MKDEKVYAWLCYNRLSLNINKTKYMIFHTRGKNISLDHFTLKVDKSFIEYVHNFWVSPLIIILIGTNI